MDKFEVAGGNSINAPDKVKATVKDGIILSDSYSLDEAFIITQNNKTNIKNMLIELSYYEDIFKGTTSGNILITDSISLIDRLALTGFDYLKLKFKKSSRNNNVMTEKYFRIYRVSDRILNNNATETYTLHFCSEELLLSEQTKISKSYSGKKISEIIYDILSNKLKIDQKYIRLQETDGLYDFVIPYKKPIEAINWLSNYAKPIGNDGADFLFYENSEGFNFFSLQRLFSQNAYTRYMYIPRSLGEDLTFSKTEELGRDILGIKSYVFLDTFDTLYGTVTGAFANRLISIDPLTRTYRDTNFDYLKYFNKSKNLNSKPIIPDIKNRLGKSANESYDAVLKVSVSNANQKKAIGISDEPWNVANDVRVENYIPNRTAQLSLSHYSRIKLQVSGDPNLTIGMVLEVILPSNRSADGSGYNEGQIDPINSGKYMITAIRHIMDHTGKYESILEVVKDSYGENIDQYKISDDMRKAMKGIV